MNASRVWGRANDAGFLHSSFSSEKATPTLPQELMYMMYIYYAWLFYAPPLKKSLARQ